MDFNKILQSLGLAFALLTGYWLNVPVAIRVLLVVILLDVFSGFLRSFADKKISSRVAWGGILKKVMTLIVIMLVSAVQNMSGLQFPAVEAVAGFYIYYEVISLIENAAGLGVPIPSALADALAQINPDKNGRRATDHTDGVG